MEPIQISDDIAHRLNALAGASGVSQNELLEALLNRSLKQASIEATFRERHGKLLFQGGTSLPADFSRADIYNNHD